MHAFDKSVLLAKIAQWAKDIKKINLKNKTISRLSKEKTLKKLVVGSILGSTYINCDIFGIPNYKTFRTMCVGK